MFRFFIQIFYSDFVFRFCVQILCSDKKVNQLIKCAGTPNSYTTANRYLTCRHTLRPGLPSTLANIEVELGYLPKPVKFDNALFKTRKSKNCKVWHIPSAQSRNRRDANTPGTSTDTERMCGECLIALRYVERALQKKRKVDGAKKLQRKRPSSNYPLKFLSPTSKRGRFQNQRLQRSPLLKRVNKLYNKTKVELPEIQSIRVE